MPVLLETVCMDCEEIEGSVLGRMNVMQFVGSTSLRDARSHVVGCLDWGA